MSFTTAKVYEDLSGGLVIVTSKKTVLHIEPGQVMLGPDRVSGLVGSLMAADSINLAAAEGIDEMISYCDLIAESHDDGRITFYLDRSSMFWNSMFQVPSLVS